MADGPHRRYDARLGDWRTRPDSPKIDFGRGALDLIAAANDDRIQEPYRRRLIPDYNAVRDTCLNGGAKTIWISGSGSTLMAVTDDTIVAKFLQVKLREQFPKCETHILTCDTEGAQIEYL